MMRSLRWFHVTGLFGLLVIAVAPLAAEPAPHLREPDWSRISGAVAPPALTARTAVLVDVESRTILYAKNPDLVLPAASLTKLVAIDVALLAAARGELPADEQFTPPAVSWAENQPAGSSLMFLGAGQHLTLGDLLLGLSVSSGNDAAVALATWLDGDVPTFAGRMNARMEELGLIDSYFVEPSGLSPQNLITARNFARFLVAHLDQFPEAVDRYYNVRTYTYPDSRHRVATTALQAITQSNRNTLLWSFDGADGFKTGFIDESGYHLAATAVRDGRRLIAIVLGIDAESHAAGGALRAAEASALLEYGFDHFVRLRFDYPTPVPVRVYRGKRPVVVPDGPADSVIVVPAGTEGRIAGTRDQRDAVLAPVAATAVGRVGISLDGVDLASASLVIPAQEAGSLWRRVLDTIVLVFRGLFEMIAGREGPMRVPSGP